MKVEIKVPAMGESITQATVGALLKSSGDYVKADEEIIELETEKVNQVLSAPQSGVLTLSVKTGTAVKIGDTLGFVETDAAAKEPPAAKPKQEAPASQATASNVIKKEEEQPPAPSPRAVTPESQAQVRVSKEAFLADLQKPETPQTPSPAPSAAPKTAKNETRRRMSSIRKVIAQRMVEAKQTTAMLTTFNEVDMSQIALLRERYQEAFTKKHGVKLGLMSFFVKACTEALKTTPELRSYIEGDEIVERQDYDIGIAVATERGLIVPVLRNCDQLSLAEIENALAQYALKAREGKLTLDDISGGCFTITNGGTFGSLLSTPIINPPQSGILGMHKIEKRAVVVNDQIVIRPMMYVALSYDHRLVDGKEAVTFLVNAKNLLEDPTRFVLNI